MKISILFDLSSRRQGTSAGSIFTGRHTFLNSPIFYVVYYILNSGGFGTSCFRPSGTLPPEPRVSGQKRTLLKFRQLTTSFTHWRQCGDLLHFVPSRTPRNSWYLSFHDCRQFGNWGRTANWRLLSTCRHHWRKQIFFIFLWRETIFGGEIFFFHLTLFVRVPSDCSKPPRSCSFPSCPSLERGYHGMSRTVFSTVGCADLFLCFLCIHPVMLHIWSTEKNHLQKHLFDKDLITTL